MSWDSVPDMLTVREVQALTRLSRTKVYALTNQPGFPVVRIDRRLLVPKRGLLEWLAKHANCPIV